jgi:hypothetical protein
MAVFQHAVRAVEALFASNFVDVSPLAFKSPHYCFTMWTTQK